MLLPITISVVIPCYNYGDYVAEAVASACAAKRGDTEVIVVDDGSSDNRTPREMAKLETRGITVIRQPNKGLASARNTAISLSNREYIFPLDADDRMRTDWIDRAIATIESDSKVGIVYGDAQCFGSRTDRWRTGTFSPDRLLNGNFIHASALYRRKVWEQNGGYDGTMPVQGFEDWDFWLGALEHGWKFVYMPEIFFDYRQATGSMLGRANESLDAVEDFVGRKHGAVYRKAWVQLAKERQSATQTARRLRKLLHVRVKQGLDKKARFSWVSE